MNPQKNLHTWYRKILFFLSVAGPSIITTMAGNDGGGVITYSLAGANYGYTMLIILPFLTVVYAITQEIGSRLAIVTGKGLADMIRERLGIRMAVFVFFAFTIANIGTLITNVSAIKTAIQMLGLPVLPVLALTIVIVVGIVVRFDYATCQKLFLTGMLLYVAYIVSAIQSRPDWGASLFHLIVPYTPGWNTHAIVLALAFVGTTITPWGQFFIQSYMKDKKVPLSKIGASKIESWVGAFFSNAVTFFIMVSTMATLYVNHIVLASGDVAARAIEPFAGVLAAKLFALGLLNAGVIGIIVVGMSTAYAFTEFFGFEGTLDATYARGKRFYHFFLGQIVVSVAIVLLPFVSLFQVVTYTQSLNALLLPMVFYFLIYFARHRETMGVYTISTLYTVLLGIAGVLIVLASTASLVLSFVTW